MLANIGYVIISAEVPEEKKTDSGLFVPRAAVENDFYITGTVVSAGASLERVPVEYKTGDVVAFAHNKALKFTRFGQTHYIVRHNEVFWTEHA